MSDSGLLESGMFSNNIVPLGTQAMTATLTSSLKGLDISLSVASSVHLTQFYQRQCLKCRS